MHACLGSTNNKNWHRGERKILLFVANMYGHLISEAKSWLIMCFGQRIVHTGNANHLTKSWQTVNSKTGTSPHSQIHGAFISYHPRRQEAINIWKASIMDLGACWLHDCAQLQCLTCPVDPIFSQQHSNIETESSDCHWIQLFLQKKSILI